jgi:hypothetical protein
MVEIAVGSQATVTITKPAQARDKAEDTGTNLKTAWSFEDDCNGGTCNYCNSYNGRFLVEASPMTEPFDFEKYNIKAILQQEGAI